VHLQPDDDRVFVGLDGLRCHWAGFGAGWLKPNGGTILDVRRRRQPG
jgi:hypothetical protein